jgi:branched-subunit amino acid transport protein
MDGLNAAEGPQAVAVPLDGLFPTWWERVLAGVAVTLLAALMVDIVVHC